MRILLATDGSNDARMAAAFLARLPWPDPSRVRIVSVVERRPSPLDFSGVRAYDDVVAAEGRRIVDEVRASISVGTAVEAAVLEGDPRDEIVREARDWQADLVVVGARGVGGVKRLLLGSVSENVLRTARCPVLVVKRPAVEIAG